MFADVAQEIEIAELTHPVKIVYEHRGVFTAIKIEKRAHLFFHSDDICPQIVHRHQIAFFVFPARVADHPGCTTDECDRPMSCLLKTPQRHQLQLVADVQAIGCRIDTNVDRARLRIEPISQLLVGRRLMDEPSPS